MTEATRKAAIQKQHRIRRAAPELLEALKLIAGYWSANMSDPPVHAGALLGDDERTIKETIMQAIAEAEGGAA